MEISRVKINQQEADPDQVRFENHRIYLSNALLRDGAENQVEFEFKNSYVTNSAGLHFYRDP